MVQYNTSTEWSNTSYWKLEPPCDKQGWKIDPLIMRSPRVYAMQSRKQRNMLLYDRCTADELRTFCISRGLLSSDVTARRNVTMIRAACIDRLERYDDEECTFSKLFDLPPELRLRIFEWYKCSLKTPPSLNAPSPIPPPFTAVSRKVREETMPVYCDTLVFQCHGSGYGWHNKGPIKMNVCTEHFFNDTPEIFLHSLRKLHILSPVRIDFPETEETNFKSHRVRWCFDLRCRTRDSRVVLDSSNEWAERLLRAETERAKQALTQQMEVIREALMDVADDICSRPHLGLRKEDADSIMEALNAEHARDEEDGFAGGYESSVEHD